MGTHLIFCGPSTSGKTTLMLGLSRESAEYDFTVDRTWTTRPRRHNEGDEENVFIDHDNFEAHRSEFLFTFQTFPSYEYAIPIPKPMAHKEVRMRILMPLHAARFRQLVAEPTVFCAISPFHTDPERIFTERDPEIDAADLAARLRRFHDDRVEAEEVAAVHFQNFEAIDLAVSSLRTVLVNHLLENNL